jgi:phosphatidate phosphatase APP1
VIRTDEEVILFPALARPVGEGRWAALLRGVVFKPCSDSLRRKALIRVIARASGVIESPKMRERLRRSLAPFLVDNKSRRRVVVEVGDARVVLGPSGRNGQVMGEAEFACAEHATSVRYVTAADEHATTRFSGTLHLLPAVGLSVISDIDDTVKHSCVPDTRELLANTFVRPHRCVKVIRVFHQYLAARGAAFHYVSASPWQLYPSLAAFARRAELPDGSFHLKTFRAKDRSALALLARPDIFKIATIEPILASWPGRRFVLVGDSAERDPEIYGEIARRRPEQVVAIVIRDITGDGRDSARIEAAMTGVPSSRWHVLADASDWTGLAAKLTGVG